MDDYKGLPMRTASGLHETSFGLLQARRPPPAQVLDLGAGEGAFTLRLQEAGYSCEAVELRPERFRLSEVRGHHLDLNADFAAEWQDKYYAVKQVAPIIVEEGDETIVVTFYTFYF